MLDCRTRQNLPCWLHLLPVSAEVRGQEGCTCLCLLSSHSRCLWRVLAQCFHKLLGPFGIPVMTSYSPYSPYSASTKVFSIR
eukprot:scaffold66238_cov43-Cyclotella_meneghiniana.AAC.6